MRTRNFGQCRRAVGLFRLCLAMIVSVTLAMGGVALNTQPVQAQFDINPTTWNSPPLQECVPFVGPTFTSTCCTCSNPPENVFFWMVGAPTWVNLDPITGELSGCPDIDSNLGSPYTFSVFCTELCSCPSGGTCDPATCSIANPPCMTISSLATVTLNVTGPPPACDMVIDPTFYPVAWEGMPFTMTLSVTGGVGPFEWSATGLPAGLSVTDPVNGVISGTPDPGTCGIHTATVTVTDLGTCCCPPVNRDFILIVDCWANYPIIIYFTTACDFTVEIGPGLTQGQANVFIDGTPRVTLGGGQYEIFTSVPCQSHLVVVDQMIQGSDPNTRFSVIGSNQKTVSDIDNIAYFDYAQEVYIQTGSEPSGVAQPPGTGFYAMGGTFSSTTPSNVDADIQKGIKYVFHGWKLPDGSTFPHRDVWFNVNRAGPVTAVYDTYYLLHLTSDYPPVDESSWHLKDTTATYDLALRAVPMRGFWGGLGGALKPVNASGTHLMTGSYTQEIMWRPDYMMPIIAIVIILLVIGGLCYFVYRLRARGPTRPTTRKKAPAPKRRRRQSTRTKSKPSSRTKRAAK